MPGRRTGRRAGRRSARRTTRRQGAINDASQPDPVQQAPAPAAAAPAPEPVQAAPTDPLAVLKERLAKGEITVEEFNQMKAALEA